MSEPETVVSLNNVTKKFNIGNLLFRKSFTALKDVSLSVEAGRTIGLIGRNGSGKTTLLRLLAKIYSPTSGTLKTKGMIAPFIELGVGFEPELTGLENIYLYAAVLGIPRKKIDLKLDSILEFSGTSKFVNVRFSDYSSGMQMRLAFAVAALTEPDILLIDEIFAVGDEQFQRRCISYFEALKRQGKTIIFVSHDLKMVNAICDYCYLLDAGRIISEGRPSDVISMYLDTLGCSTQAKKKEYLSFSSSRYGNMLAEITSVEMLDGSFKKSNTFRTNDTIVLRFNYFAHKLIKDPELGILITAKDCTRLAAPNTNSDHFKLGALSGKGTVYLKISNIPFIDGDYSVSATLLEPDKLTTYDHHENVSSFSIKNNSPDRNESAGHLKLDCKWRHVKNVSK